MDLLMYDADDPYDIPTSAPVVAGYLDGSRTTWSKQQWARFAGSKRVTISAVGQRLDADFYDVEPGCIWPMENVLPMIDHARDMGFWPGVYCNERNHWPAIRRMFQSRGIQEPPYWVANYDGIARIPQGAVAKQYAHPRDALRPVGRPQQPWETFRHFDLSVISDSWIGFKANEKEADDMSFNTTFPDSDKPAIATVALDPDRRWKLILCASGKGNKAVTIGHVYNWATSNDNVANGTGGDVAGTPWAPQDGGRVDVNEPYEYEPPAGTARCVIEYTGELVVGAFAR